MKKLEKIIYAYLWNSKVNKVKKETIVKDYDRGGIKMIDLEKLIQSFRLKWLGRILDETNAYCMERHSNVTFRTTWGIEITFELFY